MPRVSPTRPPVVLNLGAIKDPLLREELLGIWRQLERVLTDVRKDLSLVDHQYVSQNSQPTPEEGELLIWKDADATSGNPQAYIVTKQSGTVYTFASEELVP